MTALAWLHDWAGGGLTAEGATGNRYWITGQAPAFHATVLLGGETTKAARAGGDLGFAGTLEAAKAKCEAHHAKNSR